MLPLVPSPANDESTSRRVERADPAPMPPTGARTHVVRARGARPRGLSKRSPCFLSAISLWMQLQSIPTVLPQLTVRRKLSPTFAPDVSPTPRLQAPRRAPGPSRRSSIASTYCEGCDGVPPGRIDAPRAAWLKQARQSTGRPWIGKNGTIVGLPHSAQMTLVSGRRRIFPSLALHLLQCVGSC
jgi:hypothetical protein